MIDSQTLSRQVVSIPHREGPLEISYFLRTGTQETVVYLHGLGSTKDDFRGALEDPSLSAYTLFAFDFPGSGSSSYPDHYSLEIDDLVDITHSVLASFPIENITLIGHSMGGLVAVRFAEMYPDRIKRLINVEGNLTPADCALFSRRTAQHSWDEFRSGAFTKALQAEFGVLPYGGARRFADTFADSVIPRAFYDYCASIVEHSDSRTLLPAFSRMNIPRLFLHGEANKQLSYLPALGACGVQVVEVPASHHWPHLDNSDFYFHTLATFITSTGSQRRGRRHVKS